MPIYRHYKEKFYRLFGVAKHSETMEEFAVYETLYDSPGGQLWVRPKQMFFENIELNGKSVPRFAAFKPDIESIAKVTTDHVAQIQPLMEKLFGWNEAWFYGTFNNHSKFQLHLARIDGQIVGFKMGYEIDPGEFYSWLGGVDPDFRRFGIASQLMIGQHDWAKASGYKTVQTKNQNRFLDMLRLNLKHGFQISGVHESSDPGGLKIVLRKSLV